MRKKGLFILVFCAVCAGALSCGVAAVSPQDDPGKVVIVQSEESAKGSYAYMGVSLDDLTARDKSRADYPHKTGALVSSVEPGSPAEKAGIEENDIIYTFNGVKVEDSSHLVFLVQKEKPGGKAALVIYREGREKRITVTLGKREKPAIITGYAGENAEDLAKAVLDARGPALQLYKQSYSTRGRLGMALARLNGDLARYFDVRADEGVLILEVEEDSPAAKAGIRGGDILASVNGTAVSDVNGVMDALSSLEPGDTASVGVIRKGTKETFDVVLGKDQAWYQISTAPFERDKAAMEKLNQYMIQKSGDEAAKLKEEMKALKERLKEMEQRLSELEKRK
jgi:serine protease Do